MNTFTSPPLVQTTARRMPASVALSVLLHLLVLFSLHAYLHTQKPATMSPAMTLSVRLMHLPQPVPATKILATRKPAPVAVTQVPDPPGTTEQQGEHIGGIALPGPIATPFSGFQVEGNAFFQQRHAQQEAMRLYQQQAAEAQARQAAEQQARLALIQLQQILDKVMNETPAADGKCILDARMRHFECDNPALRQKILAVEPIMAEKFSALRRSGSPYNGFIFIKQYTTTALQLISDHSLASGK